MVAIEILGIIINALIMLTGVVAIFVTAHQVKRQLRLSFFEKYTNRYAQIMEHMPEEFFHEDGNELSKDKKQEINHFIRLYLDLCSEEYYLHGDKYIDEKVWNEWNEGILASFENPLVKDYWMENNEFYHRSYTNFCKYIDNEIFPKNNEN